MYKYFRKKLNYYNHVLILRNITTSNIIYNKIDNINCGGCGALLQCEYKDRAGYISANKFDKYKRHLLEHSFNDNNNDNNRNDKNIHQSNEDEEKDILYQSNDYGLKIQNEFYEMNKNYMGEISSYIMPSDDNLPAELINDLDMTNINTNDIDRIFQENHNEYNKIKNGDKAMIEVGLWLKESSENNNSLKLYDEPNDIISVDIIANNSDKVNGVPIDGADIEEDYNKFLNDDSIELPQRPNYIENKKKKFQLRCYRCHELISGKYKKHGNVYIKHIQDVRNVLSEKFYNNTNSVIIMIVDIFDFDGSWMDGLENIIGNNPLIIVANKIDLLPKGAGMIRIKGWLNNECRERGIIPHKTYLISAKDGLGIKDLITNIRRLSMKLDPNIDVIETSKARDYIFRYRLQQSEIRHLLSQNKELPDNILPLRNEYGMIHPLPSIRDVYIIGNANVGKSTLINLLIKKQYLKGNRGNYITVSNQPGTTLDLLSFPLYLHNDHKQYLQTKLYDTPGMMNPSQLTTYMNIKELDYVLPKKRIKPITYRIKKNDKMILGGFVSIELIEGRPFFFTAVVNNQVTVHIGKRIDDEFFKSTIGKHIYPPFSMERLETIGLLSSHIKTKTFDINGQGWLESAIDIVFPGLGWITITGVGHCQVKVHVPTSMLVKTRAPLMPFESYRTLKRFDGSGKKR